MPLIISYLLKLSVSLGLVYIFYQFLLRKLTFYTCNRFYLLVYSALCFIIPLINITPTLEANSWQDKDIANIIPAWQLGVSSAASMTVEQASTGVTYWNWFLYVLITGCITLTILFLVRYISFVRIRKEARLLNACEPKIYQVDKNIIPFSFGNAIFINHKLHAEEELREIIRHEFVHVKQKHSLDILWAELLCIFNWYNPFVWLLRKAIRQNLEFIADEQVVKSGLDRRQYQYMLLKVIGNNHFSIANQFNFSSLKKRIAMMNKDQTSRLQLFRLVLIVPALAVLLLAFRENSLVAGDTMPAVFQPAKIAVNDAALDEANSAVADDTQENSGPKVSVNDPKQAAKTPKAVDTVPSLNAKGYSISIRDNNGNCTIVVTDKTRKIIKSLSLNEWEKNSAYYENLYGVLPAAPPPPPAPPTPVAGVPAFAAPAPPAAPPTPGMSMPAAPPTPPAAPKLPENVHSMRVTNNKAKVILNDGTKEEYDLNNQEQKAVFEKKYGKLPEPPDPPAISRVSVKEHPAVS